MVGKIPAPGDLSMSDLAAYLTDKEQLNFTQVTELTIDSAAEKKRNMATYIAHPDQLGALLICASGEKPAQTTDTKPPLSTTAYISGSKAAIDIYRLPLTS
jgi:hypothetical protein